MVRFDHGTETSRSSNDDKLMTAVWERPNFYSSEALETSLDAALDVSGLKTDDINLFDLYS